MDGEIPHERMVASFEDAVTAIVRIANNMASDQLESPSPCAGWTGIDVVRHVRSCLGIWNERLDDEEAGRPPTVVVDFQKLNDEQKAQVEQLRAQGITVHDMNELNQASINRLGDVDHATLIRDFAVDGSRYANRVIGHGVPTFRFEVLELQLHAHDLGMVAGIHHRPRDVDLLASIWRENDPSLSGDDLWRAVVRASGRAIY